MEMLLFIGLIITGVVTGLYASIVGGGTLVIVPVFLLIGTPITTAIGTMRASAMFLELASALTFWKKGHVQCRQACMVGLATMIGGAIGASIVLTIDKVVLSYVIGVIMILLLIGLPRLGKSTRVVFSSGKIMHHIILGLVGVLLGIYGGFYGAGFGTISIYLFAFVGGLDLLSSAGNARVAGFFMSFAATVVFWEHNVIDWNLFLPTTIGTIIGSVVGVHYATRINKEWIKVLLLVVVIASVIKLFLYPG